MNKKVLLIEKNPGTQAMVSIALEDAGYDIRTISTPNAIQTNIEQVKPAAIIISDSIQGLDAFEFAKALKSIKQTNKIALIYLTDRDNIENNLEKAIENKFEEIVFKPFRSGQLSRALERALQNKAIKKTETSKSVLFLVSDPFLQKLFEKIFDKNNISWQLCENKNEIISATRNVKFPAIVVEWEAIQDLSWFSPEKMGELILTINDQTHLKTISNADKVHIVTRPLSYKKIEKVLTKFVHLSSSSNQHDVKKLEHGAQAMLAARISAAIFERLVNQQALRNGAWDTAGEAAEEELLRICREFEAMFPMRNIKNKEIEDKTANEESKKV